MKLADVPVADWYEFEFVPRFTPKIPKGIGKILPDKKGYLFRGCEIELVQKSKAVDLDYYLRRNGANAAEVQYDTGKGNALIRVHFFAGKELDLRDISVLLGDKHATYRSDSNRKRLERDCSIKIDGQQYFIIEASPNKGAAGEENMQSSFAIHTAGKRIDVEEHSLSRRSDTYYFSASRIVRQKNPNPDAPYRLAKGRVSFGDEQEAVSRYCKQNLDNILNTTGSYLQAWDDYAQTRGDRLLEIAREFGKHAYTKPEKLEGSAYRFFFDTDVPRVPKGQSIEIVSEDPLFLQQPELNWDEYVKAKQEQQQKKNSIYADILSQRGNILELHLRDNNKNAEIAEGFIVISTLGEEVQLERQRTAWQLISDAKSGIPHLGLLLEEKGDRKIPEQKSGPDIPISSVVYEKIFSHEPTQRQREAIQTAITTPDIALIQGPPGTGKTTVITAILELLNEADDKTTPSAGKVLASSYQHDAVINMIDRLSINSVPTYKFGNKAGMADYRENIADWVRSTAERVCNHNPHLQISADESAINNAVADYGSKPTRDKALFLLSMLRGVAEIDQELRDAILKLESNLKSEVVLQGVREKQRLRVIRALRIDEASFRDDGPDRAMDVYNVFEDELEKDMLALLKRVAIDDGQSGYTELPCGELASLKRKLLYRYVPRPFYAEHERDEDVLNLCRETIGMIRSKSANTSKIDRAISDWLTELEYNPIGIQNELKKFNYVYAATTQQSDGVDIRKAKSGGNDRRQFLYDTVIIDEAARATPPDLLIPMCKAAKRIILVGDHRQLPHMVEEEILRRLEIAPSASDSDNEAISIDPYRLSMFEHMFTRLKQLENHDGIRRTVTLDAQFRSHPLLGKFASSQFYEEFAEEYSSPRPADEFAHSLPGTNGSAAVWINVPASAGQEERRGSGSRYRSAEVQKIVAYLEKWINSDNGKDLSFGVISFYKAQVEEIKAQLEARGIASENAERLRIGTVDSFQGMEFDVVFLSVVRSNTRHNFGFLKAVNRLCVSMTRQKRVLAVVGDMDFCTSASARQTTAIPALAAFADLCGQQGEIL